MTHAQYRTDRKLIENIRVMLYFVVFIIIIEYNNTIIKLIQKNEVQFRVKKS